MSEAPRLTTPALAVLTLVALLALAGLTVRVGLQLREKTDLSTEQSAQADQRSRYQHVAARSLGARALVLDKATAGPALERAIAADLRAAGLPDVTATALEITSLRPGLSLVRVKVSGLASAEGVERWSRAVAAKDDTLVLEGLSMKTPPTIGARAETVAELTVLVRLRAERQP